jgi:acetyltransferase
MMEEIKGYPLLKGYRGQPPSDIESVVEIILKVAQLAQDLEAVSDIDLNPVFVRQAGKGSVVVDAKMLLSQKQSTSPV